MKNIYLKHTQFLLRYYGDFLSIVLIAMILIMAGENAEAQQWSTVSTANNLLVGNSSDNSRIVSCPNGEVIAVFESNGSVFAHKCDASGLTTSDWGSTNHNVSSWVADGRPNYIAAASDGLGGVYVAIMYTPGKIRAQHLDASGNALWGLPSNTHALALDVSTPAFAPENVGASPHPSIAGGWDGGNGANGATIVWTGRLTANGKNNILAQHINDPGVATLGSAPIAIAPDSYATQSNCDISGIFIPPTYFGGDMTYVVTWESSTPDDQGDIYTLGMSSNGSLAYPWSWYNSQIPICTATGGQHNPRILTYLEGLPASELYQPGFRANYYVVWEDGRQGNNWPDLYVSCGGDRGQEVNGDGFGDGKPLSGSSSPRNFDLALDYPSSSTGNDGNYNINADLYVAWAEGAAVGGRLFGQRVDVYGNMIWVSGANILVQGSDYFQPGRPTLVVQNDEAILTYMLINDVIGGADLYAQKISASGAPMWAQAKPLATGHGETNSPASAAILGASSCDASVVTVWTDGRLGNSSALEVYAQAMHWSDGSLGGQPSMGTADVFIQRELGDVGDESYYPPSYPLNESPDIWNTYLYPPSLQNEDPFLGQPNTLRVRLHNRGCQNASGTLTIYSTPSCLGATWPSGWTQVGMPVQIPNFGSLQSGQDYIADIPWHPQGMLGDNYCYLARYSSGSSGPEYLDPTDNSINLHNGIAQRNMINVNVPEPRALFGVNNLDTISRNIDLEINLHQLKPITSRLNGLGIKISLDPETYSSWKQTGFKGTGIKVNSDSSITITDTSHATLLGIPFGARKTAKLICKADSLGKVKDEHFYIRWAQYTELTKPTDRRLDGGLTLDVRTQQTLVVPLKGGDTVSTDLKTTKPMHVQTYAIYVSNSNKARSSINRVIIGVDSKTTILAFGPPRDSQHVTIGMAKNEIGHKYIFSEGQENQLRLYAGETFRPIYLTVAGIAGTPTKLHFTTFDSTNKVITEDSILLSDPLSIVQKQNPPGTMAKHGYLLTPFPNPAATSTSFQLHLDESDVVSISVADVLGKEVSRIVSNERLDNGDHIFMFSTVELSSGTYYVTLHTGTSSDTKSFKVIR